MVVMVNRSNMCCIINRHSELMNDASREQSAALTSGLESAGKNPRGLAKRDNCLVFHSSAEAVLNMDYALLTNLSE